MRKCFLCDEATVNNQICDNCEEEMEMLSVEADREARTCCVCFSEISKEEEAHIIAENTAAQEAWGLDAKYIEDLALDIAEQTAEVQYGDGHLCPYDSMVIETRYLKRALARFERDQGIEKKKKETIKADDYDYSDCPF